MSQHIVSSAACSVQSEARAVTHATMHALAPELVGAEATGLRCLACARRCLLREGATGYCTAIACHDGALVSTAYGVIAEASVTPIENKPVYHYRPGAQVLSLGGLGCNLRCRFCQNWEIAFRDARDAGGLHSPNLAPEAAVALALREGCAGIAWTFNEPSISPMYVRDTARLAHEAGLFTVFVTNGLLTPEALAWLGPWLDVYRVDAKSLEAAFYRRIGATSHGTDALPLAARAQGEYGAHVEVVTNLMPGLNDADDHARRLAAMICQHLGAETPWHLTSYVPYAFMTDVPPTPPATLERIRRVALSEGLRFAYTDNPETPDAAHTFCPDCGALVVERSAYGVHVRALGVDGRCVSCGRALPIVRASAEPGASLAVVLAKPERATEKSAESALRETRP